MSPWRFQLLFCFPSPFLLYMFLFIVNSIMISPHTGRASAQTWSPACFSCLAVLLLPGKGVMPLFQSSPHMTGVVVLLFLIIIPYSFINWALVLHSSCRSQSANKEGCQGSTLQRGWFSGQRHWDLARTRMLFFFFFGGGRYREVGGFLSPLISCG